MNGPAQGRLPLAVTKDLVLNPYWVPFCSPGGIDSVDSSLLHTENDRMRKHIVITGISTRARRLQLTGARGELRLGE